MRKFLFFAIPFLIAGVTASSQAYKSSYTFQKNIYPVAAIQVPFEEDAVKDALKDYMLANGFQDASYKDFLVFRDVPLDKNSSRVSDAYFLIDRKSRSEKDVTVISLLPVKKGETLTPAGEEDSSFIRVSMVYLDSLKNNVHRFSLTKLIQAQQKSLDKTKANMLELKNDSGDIAKKIRQYESELVENKNDQDKQTKVISNISSVDQEALSKAGKKMDKLRDNQADYEKKLRNYKADLENNTAERETQQSLYDSGTQALIALKKRHQNIGLAAP